MADCTIVRSGEKYAGHQGLDYSGGVSAESAGSQAICMLRLTMEPGQRARAHMHEHHETTIYLMSGRVELWYGPRLEHHEVVEAGDFVHIPAGVPHVPANTGDQRAESIIARTDPNEQESVVLLPELDELPHLPPL
ncbi:MAG TPA: cupin domain-containing protein [Thermoleophilaceae bacterium]|nr:cupin domain-containing protein [Thermoleophilaceae bacterium]